MQFYQFLDNLRYAWCFNNKAEMPSNNRSHKISPSFDVFCTDRLCSRRRTKTPENRLKDEEVCCGLGALTIASLVLIGTAEFFILITAAYAVYYCFQNSGNWDIGGN
uniref:Uncharacterized protein n=1 Tax=Panagrolaimus sp. ES5 TaxID=591445 RepID=A0AC34EYU6_9BILA